MANRYDSGANFVAPSVDADANWRPLEPAQLPSVHTPSQPTTPAQPILIESGASKSFTSIQGTHRDRTLALLIRAVPVIVIEAFTIGGLMILGYLQYQAKVGYFGAGWLVLTGICGLVTFLFMSNQDNAHSPSGVERQRNSLTADVATETHETSVNAWRDVQLAEINAKYDYLNRVTMLEHDDRMRRLEDKRG